MMPRRRRSRALGYAFLGAAILLAWPAVAAPPSDAARNEARERFDRGLKLVNQNDNEGALAEFRRAYELVPHPILLYNMGLVLAATNRPVEAVETLDRLLAAPADLDAERLTRAQDERARQLGRIGEIEVASSIAGASIELDGVEVGRAPLRAPLRVASGDHIVGAVAPGHAPLRRKVSVAGQARARVELELTPIEGKPAQLEIVSRVPEAEVLVDGQLVGHTPLGASLALAPGTRSIEARRPGYVSARQTLNLGPGSTGRIDLNPSPDPAALATEGGVLSLAISEPDAVVFVDGEPRGAYSQPLRLAHGVHWLRVERADFLPFERKVVVPKAATNSVPIELEPTPEKRADYRSSAVTQRTWGYLTTGAGAVMALGSLGFLIWNSGEESEAEEHFDTEARKQEAGGECDRSAGMQTNACIQALELALDDLESVRSREKFGWVGVGVGAAAATLGVTLLLTNDDPDRYEPRPESDVFGRLRLAPTAWVGSNGGGAALSGRF